MRLAEVKVSLFWNIVDSGPVPVENDVTCLVGRNESGKTAFMRALYQLNPAYVGQLKPTINEDYPRWRMARDRREQDINKVVLVQGSFVLEGTERQIIVESFDPALPFELPATVRVVAKRTYGGELLLALEAPEADVVQALLEMAAIPTQAESQALTSTTLADLESLVEASKGPSARGLKRLQSAIPAARELFAGHLPKPVYDAIKGRLPRFFYFSQYNLLAGRIDLVELLAKQPSALQDHERTALSLLRLAGVSGKEFQAEDFEYRVSELEAAANLITQEVFHYWTTNRDLAVSLVVDDQVQAPQGQKVVHRFLDIRLHDQRHMVTTNLERRSSGFRWFFSFIAAFSEFEHDPGALIVLLDEPGLNLHAKAQHDFLRFINEKLANQRQVLYTTHSPFMVEPGRLQRVRLVQDNSTRETPDLGAKVSADILSVDADTLFPLQGALGYDLAQNLFIGAHNLLLEGTSDYAYLMTLSEHLAELGRVGLDPRWNLVPVGGVDKVPTFVALLGNHLDITVLLHASSRPNQRLADLANRGLLNTNRIIAVNLVTGAHEADIEDLFVPGEYLQLVNSAFDWDIREADLDGDGPIVRRIERTRGERFSHERPATELMRRKVEFLPTLSEETLTRFEQLFQAVNASMPSTAR